MSVKLSDSAETALVESTIWSLSPSVTVTVAFTLISVPRFSVLTSVFCGSLACSSATLEVSFTWLPLTTATVKAVDSSEPLPSPSYMPEICVGESDTSLMSWLPSVVFRPVTSLPDISSV